MCQYIECIEERRYLRTQIWETSLLVDRKKKKKRLLKKDQEGKVRIGKREEKGYACRSKREKHFKEVEDH